MYYIMAEGVYKPFFTYIITIEDGEGLLGDRWGDTGGD